LRAAIVDPEGRVLERASAPTLVEEGPEAVIGRSVELLRTVRARGRGAEATAIGVSASGPLDPLKGAWIEPPNFGPAFRGAPIADPLRAALGLPAVVALDTHVAALAEQTFGAAQGALDFIYITLSTGIGGAIVAAGELIRGADGVAGEVGHLVIEIDGPPCGCGGRGHLEAIASGVAIARAGEAAAAEGRSPALVKARARGPLEARDVASAEADGDAAAHEIMARARRAFAAAAAGLVNLLNPELIIVGGGMAEAAPDPWLEAAREAVRHEAYGVTAARVRIVQAELGPDVSLVGAVPLLRSRRAN
jgi:glucokinase